MTDLYTPALTLLPSTPNDLIVDAATRREFIAMMVAAGLFAACGDDADDNVDASPTTRQVTDDTGRVVDLPVQPRRVAILDEEVAAHLVTLGFVPAGLAWTYGPDYQATLRSFNGPPVDVSTIEDLGSGMAGELNFERITALQPDLILGHPSHVDAIETLSGIAPTVLVDPRTNRNGESFQRARFLAEIVGLDEVLDAKITDYTEAIDAFRSVHGDALEGLDYVYWDTGFDGLVYAYDVAEFAVNAVFADLGVPQSSAMREAADPDSGYLEVSVERIADYPASLIFLGRYDGQPTEDVVVSVLSTTAAADAGQIVANRNANRWTFHLLQSQIDVLAELDELFTNQEIRPV